MHKRLTVLETVTGCVHHSFEVRIILGFFKVDVCSGKLKAEERTFLRVKSVGSLMSFIFLC